MISRFEQFTLSVASLYRCIQKIERVEMAKFGLKGPHAQCLLAMHRRPEGVTSSELCTLCDKDKAAISRTVTELEREGMITRLAKNGSMYRAALKLTPRGQEAARQVDERAQFAVEKAGECLTDQERIIMYKALAMIASNLQTICAEGLEEQED
ncbi:MAG: MarR family transcriptional regulator [Oscillospiraceae bacterium]|nr:MarR family transcriptional regulator [Oscillospiraceae bacterium]MBO5324353.1 MarR family transcriptional regulator [Oscillospiraceae bacterium]